MDDVRHALPEAAPPPLPHPAGAAVEATEPPQVRPERRSHAGAPDDAPPPAVPLEGYRALFDLASEAMYLLDGRTGRMLDVNRRACELHGYSREELLRLGVSVVGTGEPPYSEADARRHVERVHAGETQTFEWQARHSSGRRFWIDVILRPVRIAGEPCVLASARDVTGRRAAEEALRVSETRFRTVFEQFPLSVQIFSPDGRSVETNRAWERFFGMKPEDVRDFNVLTEPQLEPIRPMILRAFAGEALQVPPSLFDARRVAPDGADAAGEEIAGPRWVQAFMCPVTEEDGAVREVFVIHQDVTQQKEAEEVLRRSHDELERAVELRTVELAETNAALEEEIAERERAEEELRAKSSELEAVFRALPDLYFRIRGDGTFVGYRGDNRSILYAPPESFLGRTLREVLPASVAGSMEAAIGEVLRGGELKLVEYALAAGGETHEFEARILPLADDEVVCIVRDITARKEAEAALRDSEAHFRRLIEDSNDLIQLIDTEGVIRYTSPSAARLLGYTPEEVIGRAPGEFIHPDDVDRVQAELMEIVRAPGTTRAAEFRIRHANGGWRVYEGLARTVSPTSAAEGVVANARDVTERKQVEEALRFQTTLLEAQSHAVLDGILVSHQGRVLSMNERYAELFRIPQELRDPARCAEMFDWVCARTADPEGYRATVARLRHDPERTQHDEVALADGRALERYTAPLKSPEGHLYGRIWAVRDVTERRRFEEELRQAKEEAERANEAKSEFLSRMSHELRTPLNSILGFAQVLQRRGLAPEQRPSLEHILKAGRHLLNLINEVLDIARIEANRQQFSIEPVPVRGVAQEALSLIQPLAAEHGCRVEALECAPEWHVRADRQRLTQVLLNLLSNAVKYNRPGGRVGLRFEPVAGEDGAAERLRIGVWDTGRGIPPERMGELFVPFARLGAEQGGVEGTGLGLALSKRLVEAMDGSLTVESAPGVGSTFRVELPLTRSPLDGWAAARGSVPAPPPRPEPGPDAATLLYVEDNVANLSLIETVLESRPEITLISALQGRMGLDLALRHRPDLILLDLHLPDLPGVEVLRRLQDEPATRDVPVVVISADATARTIERLLAEGARSYLTKPIDVDQLLETVDGILEDRPRRGGVGPDGG